MSAQYDSYLTAFRDVLGLNLPVYEKYKYWEDCAKLGGFRYMHANFCMVTDFPDFIRIDDNKLPHCEDGPSHRWSDGWSIWSIHGVLVDEQIVMRPDTQTIEQIEREENEEIRRIRIERFGWNRYLDQSGAKVIDQRKNDRDLQVETLYKLKDGSRRFRCVDPSTGREYALGVPSDVVSCVESQKWMSHGLDGRAIHRS